MSDPTQNKTDQMDVVDSAAKPASAPSVPDAETQGSSWGDKYKHKAQHFVRNILVNYIINFGISAAGTYAVLKSPLYIKHFEPKVKEWSVKLHAKTNIPPAFSSTIVELFTTTQLLLCGGHSLLPYMKWSHDNRRKQEFDFGHRLDKLQESLGFGNVASKRNLEEYKYVKDLLKTNKPDALDTTDKALLLKHGIDDNLHFKENRQTVWHVVKARLAGMSFTSTLSLILAAGSYLAEQKGITALDFKQKFIDLGNKVGPKLYSGLSPKIIKDPGFLGYLTLLELVYTAASKLGFDKMENRQLRKREWQEKQEAEAALAGDRKVLSDSGIRPDDAADIQKLVQSDRAANLKPRLSALEERNRILQEGAARDFRGRAEARANEPVMALGG